MGAVSGHPYYPLEDGQSATYVINAIEGRWNELTCELAITERLGFLGQHRLSYGRSTCPPFFADGLLGYEYEHEVDMPGTPPANFADCFQEAWAMLDGVAYAGEAISPDGRVLLPPICKITWDPVEGETLDSPGSVFYYDPVSDPPGLPVASGNSYELNCVTGGPEVASRSTPWRWRYRTVRHYAEWGTFRDVWRTGLREFSGQVYNYAFARGLGMVNYWYGRLDEDGSTVRGYEYYAVRLPSTGPDRPGGAG